MMGRDEVAKHTAQIHRVTWCAAVCILLGFASGFVGIWRVGFDSGGFSVNNLAALGSFLQGSVGSFWALGGLLIIYVAFLAQKKQLALQARELQSQKEQWLTQMASIGRQNFESSFFQLLHLHNQVVSDLRWGGNIKVEDEPQGRMAFKDIYEKFRREFLYSQEGQDATFIESEEFVRQAYVAFYTPVQDLLGHYFRNLYHIFKFVDISAIEDKRRYTSLVCAQLSAYELALLFYNGLSVHGNQRFKPLIERYGLLKNMDKGLLINPAHAKLYAPTAYP